MSEWQPIATAPMDGATCIVASPIRNDAANGYFVTSAKFVSSVFCGVDYSGWNQMPDEEGIVGIWDPHFWMPLPNPPKPNTPEQIGEEK